MARHLTPEAEKELLAMLARAVPEGFVGGKVTLEIGIQNGGIGSVKVTVTSELKK